MAIALSPERRFDYVLEAERELPLEQRTIWKLRALTQMERERIVNELTMHKANHRGGLDTMANALRCGLDGWSNFPDPTGRETPFDGVPPLGVHAWIKRPVILSDAGLDCIPFEYWEELCKAIIGATQLKEADLKN